MVVGTVEAAARIRRLQPLECLLMANMHPQRHLRLAAITPEVPLADQEAEEEANVEITLVGDELTTEGATGWIRSRHERNLRPPAVSPSSCVRNNALASERRGPEFSTGWRRRITSSTRAGRSWRRLAWGNPG